MPAHYTDDYIEQAFYIWYRNNKCGSHKLINLLPKTDAGNSPARMVIERWLIERGWKERADALDAEVSMKLDIEVIDERTAMYKRLAEIGREETEMGYTFLKEHGIQKEENALRAISDGTALQQRAVGGAEFLQKVLTMSNEQLDKELLKLTGKTPKMENEFDVDAGVEDITDDAIPDTVSTNGDE
jgi:hypothetical protein